MEGHSVSMSITVCIPVKCFTCSHVIPMHVACVAGEEVWTGNSMTVHDVPVLAFHQTPGQGSGRILVFGDSN